MTVSPVLVRWLLKSKQPSVALRVFRELQDLPDSDPKIRAARARLARDGWAPAILRLQLEGGQWTSPESTSRDLYVPKYIATNWRLLVLSDLGLTKAHPGVARGAELLLRRESGGGGGLGGSSSELCFTGNCVRMLTRFGYGADPRVERALEWLVQRQKADGGWNCFRSRNGTLDGWEALAAFSAIAPENRSTKVLRAIERGAEFYLERRLLREGTGDYPPWHRLHYPNHYYYDLLVGLGVLTALGYGHDARLGPALDELESKRNPKGSWDLEALHPDLPLGEEYQISTPYYPFALERPGEPSYWLTTSALIVLRRAGRL